MLKSIEIAQRFADFGLGAVVAVIMTLLVVWLIRQFCAERKDWYDRQDRKDEKLLEALKSIEEAMKNICKNK